MRPEREAGSDPRLGPDPVPVLKRIRDILSVPGDRVGKARRIAAAVRDLGGYRWVGIYDTERLIAWSGSASRGDVPPETGIPIRNTGDSIVGWLDAEGGSADLRFLERCAAALAPIWS